MAERTKVVLAGEGAIARQHIAALRRIDDVDVVGRRRGDAERHRRLRRRVRHRPPRPRPRRGARRRPASTPSSCASPRRCTPPRPSRSMEAGKHVLVEIPMADSLADAEAVVAAQRAHRRDGHGVPHPPLQPEPPVGPPAHRGRRAHAAAPGRLDVLPAPREQERARPAAARGPTTCCGTTPATRSTCSSTRPATCRTGPGPAGPAAPRARHRHGHDRRAAVARRARCARWPCRSTTTARSARRSATSATPAPTWPATTTWPTATASRSTCPASACRRERHREPGPRVRRRRPRGPRAGVQRRPVPADHAGPRPPPAGPVKPRRCPTHVPVVIIGGGPGRAAAVPGCCSWPASTR